LLDANVLIALTVADHVHYQAARRWLAAVGDAFATCPITEGSLVRHILRQGKDSSTAQAILAAIHEHPRHEFWPDSLSFRGIPLRGIIGHRQVTDAYLAQLARTYQGKLVSFDRGLADLHGDVVELIPTG
jgi:toxin-antitoxin system PIN domain toxin